MSSSRYRCIVHGSYQKDLELIRHIVELFRFVGVEVLYPSSLVTENPEAKFVRFHGDTGTPAEIEHSLVETLRENAQHPKFFSYFVNKDGYLGPSACYELSLVQETRATFYALEQPSSIPLEIPNEHIVRPIDVARKVLHDV